MDKGFHKIAVNMPREIYVKIKKRAEKANISFSAQTVDLLRCGILCIEESELHDEPMVVTHQ